MSAAKSIPSVLTPAARRERSFRLLAEGIHEAVRAILEEEAAAGEWIDQHHSPLGKRVHLELCRTGKLPSKKLGKRVLVKREDMNAHIERNGLSRGRNVEPDDVVDIVERITSRGKR
jgi:hypothetical protein